MKVMWTRLVVAMVAALAAFLALAGATTSKAPILQPDKLIILSTTDVKGKTSPCG
jgi:hypothetical protein